jgi:hypothetical protein
MKASFSSVALALLIVSSLSAFGDPADTLRLLGLPKTELLSQYGAPKQILGPEDGYQTYEYPNGLSVVIRQGKVVQYVAKDNSGYKTETGIGLGSDIGAVTKVYGDYTGTEEVEQWFGGRKQNVLYHHPKYDRFKINYAERDVIFMFDGNKKVESIWVGYIFPKE